jgi:mono/diheme cytochrome c family protein
MKKLLKWIGIILGVLIVIVIAAVLYLGNKADKMMSQKFNVTPPVFTIPADSASIAYGEKFAAGCKECHGDNLGGKVFFDDPTIGKIYSINLTKGKGGIGSSYTDLDWIRSTRHGVRPNGDGLMVMPAKDHFYMSERDISCIIAYCKSVPPIDNEAGKNELKTMGKILMALGAFGEMFSASAIKDHSKPPGSAPPVGPTAEYGNYLVRITGCRTCHNSDLGGGKSPDPNSPPVPNLTPAGNLPKWGANGFINTLRTGKTPEGKALDAKFMPYKAYAKFSNNDLTAMHAYFLSLPKAEPKK